jgi:hypothetical protein
VARRRLKAPVLRQEVGRISQAASLAPTWAAISANERSSSSFIATTCDRRAAGRRPIRDPRARRGPRIDSRRVENVSTVFELTSSVWTPCPVCRSAVGRVSADSAALDERVTHLLQEHNATLFHVGQESSTDGDGNPWQMTVAVVGT